jgi:hypothetical protein
MAILRSIGYSPFGLSIDGIIIAETMEKSTFSRKFSKKFFRSQEMRFVFQNNVSKITFSG